MTPTSRQPATPELSRTENVADLRGREPRTLAVSATATERVALARRFGLLELPRLEATVEIRRTDDGVLARIEIEAEVVQACVVSLDPVPATLSEHVDLFFAKRIPTAATTGEIVIDPEAEDPPEELVGDSIDLGEVVAEHFGLALDPFPRRPDAVFAGPDAGTAAADGGPFAALRRLKP